MPLKWTGAIPSCLDVELNHGLELQFPLISNTFSAMDSVVSNAFEGEVLTSFASPCLKQVPCVLTRESGAVNFPQGMRT